MNCLVITENINISELPKIKRRICLAMNRQGSKSLSIEALAARIIELAGESINQQDLDRIMDHAQAIQFEAEDMRAGLGSISGKISDLTIRQNNE